MHLTNQRHNIDDVMQILHTDVSVMRTASV
jgi:hypothetical protein